MKKHRLTWALSGLALGVSAALIVVGALQDNHPLSTLSPAGDKGDLIHRLIIPVFIVAGVVFFLVQGAVLYMSQRYREEPPEDGNGLYDNEEFPEQTHGNVKLEVLWTAIPTVLMAVIGVFSVIAVFELNEVDAAEDDLKIVVVGQQWWWEYQYHMDGDLSTPPDFVNADEVVFPVGLDVELQVTSRDVIHSFWIPKLNGKRDAVPGRTSPWVLQANKPGRYAGQCTEFCGLSHGWMRMYAVALERDEFEVWATNQALEKTPLVDGDPGFAGQEVFITNCQGCHVIVGITSRDRDGDGTVEPDTWDMYDGANKFIEGLPAGAVPNLTHFASRTTYAGSIFDLYVDRAEDVPYTQVAELGVVDVAQLEAWLRDPPAEKPADADAGRGMPDLNLSEDQIDQLVEFLIGLD